MAYALIDHKSGAFSTSGGTPNIVFTGADLITVFVVWYDQDPDPVIVDNQTPSNTYVKLTVKADGVFLKGAIFYANATTGTFTTGGSVSVGFVTGPRFSYVEAASWSGSRTASDAYDSVQNGGTTAGATSLATGSVTPNSGHNNALIFCGLGFSASNSPTINGGFSSIDYIDFASGLNFGGIAGYLTQTTAAAANPTWAWNTSTDALAPIAVFRAADESGGGGGGGYLQSPSLPMVGMQ